MFMCVTHAPLAYVYLYFGAEYCGWAGDRRRDFPSGRPDHRHRCWWLFRLLLQEVQRRPSFREQTDRRHRVRRLLLVSDQCGHPALKHHHADGIDEQIGACRISAAVALILFLVVGVFALGSYASGGVLTLIATALCITSFIMLRSPPVDAADTTTVTGKVPVQVQPRDFPMSSPTAGGGAMSHPMSSPTGTTGVSPLPVSNVNAYMGHPPSHTSVAVVDKPPHPHTVVTVCGEEPQLPRPQMYPVHHQPAQRYPVQTQESGEQPLLISQQQPPSPHQVTHVVQQPPQPPQHTVPSHQVCGDIPIPPTPAARTPPQGKVIDQANTRLQTGIKTVANIGTRVIVEAMKQSLAPDNADPAGMAGGILLSMATGAIGGGGDAGAAECGDAGY